MKKMKNAGSLSLGIVLGFVSLGAECAVTWVDPSTIAQIDSYTQFGGGDVTFTLTSNSLQAQCPFGFWIRASDGAGAKTVVSEITAAFHSEKTVVVWADPAILWGGSSSAACLVWGVRVL